MSSNLNQNNFLVESSPSKSTLFQFERLRRFMDEYKKYSENVLLPLQKQILKIFDQWNESSYWDNNNSVAAAPIVPPVLRCRIRIKNTEAVVRKILAKQDSYPDGFLSNSFKKMTDTLGTRVIVSFLSGLSVLDREIRESGMFEISRRKPPYAYLNENIYNKLNLKMDRRSKPSGYSSIHYTVRLSKNIYPVGERPWFELQLRTLTQDVWAELEHLLGYKHNTPSSQVKGQFQLIGRLLTTIDEHLDVLQSDIVERQTRVVLKDDQPLDAENLPGILSEQGLTCSQYDVAGLLKLAKGCKIATVRDLRDVLSADNIQAIYAAEKNAQGKKPYGSRLIAALMLLYGHHDATDKENALESWKEFSKILPEYKIKSDVNIDNNIN